ncbi:hypothetical protein AN480_28865 (plasmid) [Mycobacterium intracellulare subsp. chimaera]|uniref:hypothetical protein n=1 Tax=Mycobacterium intracellulare TaxID=1767 RepID=UPI00090A1DD6|nr:hypothetical protein [Mycobacterium intracellulare]AOS95035.2 hypothetical protein AN480_28865 [Mycobacterium intracellulare subsp. chimaera]
MDYRITQDDRVGFKRCRRQWDFASPHRRGLEPAGVVDPVLPAALNNALAVYYYPGTWDWPPELKQSLVHKAAARALNDACATDRLQTATALLDTYDAWARTIDDFAPIKIDHDVQGLVPDPRDPDRGLMTPHGSAVIYTCRIDLLAVDAADEYWVVRHQIVDEWQELDTLIRDEAAVAGCWAWEREYLGMEIAGTIHDEVRITGPLELPSADRTADGESTRVRQGEPSGGGRAIPQHRRMFARTARTDETNRVQQCTAGLLRRTRIRRSRAEISAVGMVIGTEAIDMTSDPAIYPTFAPHCQTCEFSSPCLALIEGTDPEPLLAQRFRPHPAEDRRKPRLGQATWGFGRGAAPPQW